MQSGTFPGEEEEYDWELTLPAAGVAYGQEDVAHQFAGLSVTASPFEAGHVAERGDSSLSPRSGRQRSANEQAAAGLLESSEWLIAAYGGGSTDKIFSSEYAGGDQISSSAEQSRSFHSACCSAVM
jgi:hypothetical protein